MPFDITHPSHMLSWERELKRLSGSFSVCHVTGELELLNESASGAQCNWWPAVTDRWATELLSAFANGTFSFWCHQSHAGLKRECDRERELTNGSFSEPCGCWARAIERERELNYIQPMYFLRGWCPSAGAKACFKRERGEQCLSRSYLVFNLHVCMLGEKMLGVGGIDELENDLVK